MAHKKKQPATPPFDRPTERSEVIAVIIRAVQMLAGVCNGARTWDGQGFNKLDAQIGRDLAEKSHTRTLTVPQIKLAYKLARRYEVTQLWPAGIVLPDSETVAALEAQPHIPAIPSGLTPAQAERLARPDGSIDTTSNGRYVLVRFAYDVGKVERMRAIKREHGGYYDRETYRAWVMPVDAIEAIADTFPTFTQSDDVRAALARQRSGRLLHVEQVSLFDTQRQVAQ